MIDATPLKRGACTSELAYGASYLASSESRFVIGTELAIDRGYLAVQRELRIDMLGLVVSADWSPKPTYDVTVDESRNRRAVIGSEVWRNPRWEVAERPMPELASPHDVIIQTRAVGFCGSDLHMYETDDDGYLVLPYRMKLPTAVGHEFSGQVVEVGSAVTRVRVGDAVAVEAQSNCDSCAACRRDLPNLCEYGEDLGFTRDGGSAQFVVAHEKHCWPLNGIREHVGDARVYDIGAVIEPTSIAYNGMFIRAGGFRPGGHVGVFGCGPVGLAAVALARAAGAGRILAIDTQAERLALASQMGADTVLNPNEADDIGARIRDLTADAGIDMAVEATGVMKHTVTFIENALAFGGKLVLIGLEAHRVAINTVTLQMKGAQICAALGHLGGGFPAVIELHRARRIDLSPIITSRYPLKDGLAAIKRLAQRQDAKILIYPNATHSKAPMR